ncbi:Coiled-coil protein [Giardia muris]|uniref:Coiled-coil protein n=1 Tax=Giardia muris TaxID=5742 RepID=A0A4Z1SXK2_GIAMU|nr:Coiled-coil protein [Giardia muris]|eukprot:TNJ29545.1 Coiled-coil protein [Giardia muris]
MDTSGDSLHDYEEVIRRILSRADFEELKGTDLDATGTSLRASALEMPKADLTESHPENSPVVNILAGARLEIERNRQQIRALKTELREKAGLIGSLESELEATQSMAESYRLQSETSSVLPPEHTSAPVQTSPVNRTTSMAAITQTSPFLDVTFGSMASERDEVAALREELSVLHDKYATLVAENAATRQSVSSRQSEADFSSFRSTLEQQQLVMAHEGAVARLEATKVELDLARRHIDELKAQVSVLQGAKESAEARISQLEDENSLLQHDYSSLEERCALVCEESRRIEEKARVSGVELDTIRRKHEAALEEVRLGRDAAEEESKRLVDRLRSREADAEELANQLKAAREDARSLLATTDVIKRENNELRAELEQKSTSFAEQINEILAANGRKHDLAITELRAELLSAQKQRDALAKEVAVLSEQAPRATRPENSDEDLCAQNAALKQKVSEQAADLERARARTQTLAADLDFAKEQLDKLVAKYERQTKAKAELQGALRELDGKARTDREALEAKHRQELARAEGELQNLQLEFKRLKNTAKNATDVQEAYTAELTQLREALAGCRAKYEASRAEHVEVVQSLTKENAELREKIHGLTDECAELTTKYNKAIARPHELELELERLRHECTILKADLEAHTITARSSQGRSQGGLNGGQRSNETSYRETAERLGIENSALRLELAQLQGTALDVTERTSQKLTTLVQENRLLKSQLQTKTKDLGRTMTLIQEGNEAIAQLSRDKAALEAEIREKDSLLQTTRARSLSREAAHTAQLLQLELERQGDTGGLALSDVLERTGRLLRKTTTFGSVSTHTLGQPSRDDIDDDIVRLALLREELQDSVSRHSAALKK